MEEPKVTASTSAELNRWSVHSFFRTVRSLSESCRLASEAALVEKA